MSSKTKPYRILFLHHSTGDIILNGGEQLSLIERKLFKNRTYIKRWFKDYNRKHNTNYIIEDQIFPKQQPYGWQNNPFDYYNIWVKNAGPQPYMNEPTLEILTRKYDLVVFKHCYPVGDIKEDGNQPNIDSPEKKIENYKLQYEALKKKMKQFPQTKFLVWTGAARIKAATNEEQACRAKAFFDWVKCDWDTPTDNIFIFDFYNLETEGTLYLKVENAKSPDNSHPGKLFARKVAPIFCQRIVEVIELNK